MLTGFLGHGLLDLRLWELQDLPYLEKGVWEMDDLMNVGIMITFILLCVSTMLTIFTGMGTISGSEFGLPSDTPFLSVNMAAAVEDAPVEDSTSTLNPLDAISRWLKSIMDNFINFIRFLWSCATGWVFLIRGVLKPIGLEDYVGTPLIIIFSFIQIGTFVEVVRRLLSGVRGVTG